MHDTSLFSQDDVVLFVALINDVVMTKETPRGISYIVQSPLG